MYDYDFDEFPRYIPVAERKAKAAKLLAKLKKKDPAVHPVQVKSKIKIAQSFWGQAWCKNVESYRDLAYRAERGRSYLRAGAVVDLRISERKVIARVSGSRLYKVKVKFKKLPNPSWQKFAAKCTGEIDSLIALLSGKVPENVAKLITHKNHGLFPSPSEVSFDCNCPDYADLCKHIAAVLYGIGVRFDADPSLFFLLRGVDPSALVGQAHDEIAELDRSDNDHKNLENIFGIELEKKH